VEPAKASPSVVITPLSSSENDAFEKIRAELAPFSSANENREAEAPSGDEASDQPYGLGPEALDALPLALIITRGENILYSNRAFAELTGFPDIAELNEIGLNALFGEPMPTTSEQSHADRDGSVTLVHRDGNVIASRSHLQRVPWMGRNALMFAFEPLSAPVAATTADGVIGPETGEITDQETDRLMEENAELRAILDTATDGVITIDEHGDIRSMNAAATALFGYETGALLGEPFSVLFAHESQRQVLTYVQAMGSNGVANVLNEGREVTGQEAQGGEIKLFMTLGRLSASNGLCAVLRDISAWKQNEEALEEARNEAESASEMKSAFLAKVSHEIRTPLNAIIGFSEIMSEERFGPIGNEKYKDYLDDIKKSGRYVVDLVNDLLDISKIESGNQELLFEGVALNETVSEVIDMLRPQANRSRIIVRTGLDPDLPEIVADQRATKQIITNLLSNAIRYTPEGGQVVISTRYLTDGSVTLHIRDTGVGMTQEEIEGALRPFKQVGADDELRAAGTGLGLPLTRALVEANRADFSISSTPGEGTDVEIIFPAPRVLAQ
ncbi:MAG: ATP-binding protein, partial [Pseudomonadota bacterium]